MMLKNSFIPIITFALFSSVAYANTEGSNVSNHLNGNEKSDSSRLPFVRIVQLIFIKEYHAARELARNTEPDHPNYHVRLRFVEALILKSEGKYEASAQEMRLILQENPNFLAVAQELAHTEKLLQTGKEAEIARDQFTQLRKDFSNRAERFTVSETKEENPLRMRGYFGLAPGKREKSGSGVIYVNGAPFPVTAPPQEKSNIGANAGVSIGYRFQPNEKTGITPGVAYHGKLSDNSALNEEFIRTEVTFDYLLRKANAFFTVYSDRGFFGGSGFSHDVGVNVGINTKRDADGSDTISIGTARNLFDRAKAANGVTHEIYYEKEIATGEDHGLLLDLRASTKNAKEKFNGYDGAAFGAGGYFIAPFSIQNIIRFEYGYVKYKAIDPLFLLQRRARPFSFSFVAQKTDLNFSGFTPVFEYRYRDTRDSIGIYRLTSHEFGIKAIRNF